MSTDPAIRAAAESVSERVDFRNVGLDPATLIALLTTILPLLFRCLQINDDVTPSTAQARIRHMHAQNPKRLMRRTTRAVRHEAERSGEPLTDDAAREIAKAIVADAVAAESEFAVRAFAAGMAEGGG